MRHVEKPRPRAWVSAGARGRPHGAEAARGLTAVQRGRGRPSVSHGPHAGVGDCGVSAMPLPPPAPSPEGPGETQSMVVLLLKFSTFNPLSLFLCKMKGGPVHTVRRNTEHGKRLSENHRSSTADVG